MKSMETPDLLKLLNEANSGRYTFNQTDQQAEIDIFGEIDDWFGYGAQQMAMDLNNSKGKDLLVRIHSPGGMVTEGMAISNILRGYAGEVTTQGIGLVASIATVILLAGRKKKVKMAENAFFMIHRPFSFMVGDADDLRSNADRLDKIESQLADIYTRARVDRGILINDSYDETRNEVLEWMRNETWFTAQEAQEAGFIDEVTEAAEFVTSDNVVELSQHLAKYQNVPAALLNSITEKQPNKMSDKKSFFAGLRDLLVTNDIDLDEAGADQATEEVTTEVEPEPLTIEDHRKALEAAGFKIVEVVDEQEPEVQPEPETVKEEEPELVLALKDELEQMKAEMAKLKAAKATPSGGATTDEPGASRPHNKQREQQFSGFAKLFKEKARKG